MSIPIDGLTVVHGTGLHSVTPYDPPSTEWVAEYLASHHAALDFETLTNPVMLAPYAIHVSNATLPLAVTCFHAPGDDQPPDVDPDLRLVALPGGDQPPGVDPDLRLGPHDLAVTGTCTAARPRRRPLLRQHRRVRSRTRPQPTGAQIITQERCCCACGATPTPTHLLAHAPTAARITGSSCKSDFVAHTTPHALLLLPSVLPAPPHAHAALSPYA